MLLSLAAWPGPGPNSTSKHEADITLKTNEHTLYAVLYDNVHSYNVLYQNIAITLYRCLYFYYVTLCLILLGAEAHLPRLALRSPRSFLPTSACAVSARARELVQYIVRMKICDKALGVSWWIEPLGKFLEYSRSPAREYWRSPSGFLSGFALRKSVGGPSIFSLGTP